MADTSPCPSPDQRVDLWDLSSIRRRLDQLGLAKGIPDVFGDPDQHQPPRRVDRIDVPRHRCFRLEQFLRPATLYLAAGGTSGCFSSPISPTLLPLKSGLNAGNGSASGGWRSPIWRHSLAILPDSAVAANDLAWTMVAAPDPSQRGRGGCLARRAAEIEPEWPWFQNTLGAALYRAGRFPEAVAVLERNIPQNPADVGLDLIFLAMCRQRMGQQAAPHVPP